MMARILVWIAERVCEIAAGAVITLLYFGSNNNPVYPGIVGDFVINASLVAFYYVPSGFIVSVVYFGLIARRQSPIAQGFVMGSLFLVHLVLFTIFVGNLGTKSSAVLAASGFAVVTAISILGTIVLKRVQKPSDAIVAS